MPEINLSKNYCVNNEKLSAFFDGEEILSVLEQAHVQGCSECRDKLGYFKNIHSSINVALDKACPDDIAERVMNGFKEKLRINDGIDYDYEKQKSIHRRTETSMLFARIAALVAFSCLVGYFVFTSMLRQERIETVENTQPRITVSADLSGGNPFGSVNYSDVSKISFVGSNPLSDAESSAKIDTTVKHVWVTKSHEADAASKINNMLNLIGLKKDNVSVKSEKGILMISTEMTARQAAQFVKICRSSGCNLLSPQQPQPEQSCFAGTGTEPVIYEARFVLAPEK